jgi:hypothetical protein
VDVTDNKLSLDATKLLEIMDSFSTPMHAHLTSEPQSLLALSRFSTPEKPIDLAAIALAQGKKSVTFDFTLNVMPCFLLNMENVEFEEGRWQSFPPVPAPVKWIMVSVIPLPRRRWWRFTSCGTDGKRKRLAV